MGFGDEIMVTGQAKQYQAVDPRPIIVLDRHDRPRSHELWRGNPRIVSSYNDRDKVQFLKNGSHCRPYYDYRNYDEKRWVYTNWKCSPGEIYLTKSEREFGEKYKDYIIIEPHIKTRASPNKSWGFDRTQQLIKILPQLRWAQLGPGHEAPLEGVEIIVTRDFRSACSIMSNAKAYVGPEGGLHHAAAVFNVPGVIIFGGMTSPNNTGYDCHINLVSDDDMTPCGWRIPCNHCKEAMSKFPPELVAEELRGIL